MLRVGPANAGGGPWELYIWRSASHEWNFSLLSGTDRTKTLQEITDPQTTIAGLANIKKRLKELPPGAEVVWQSYMKEPIPETITEDLLRFSEREGLNLTVMWQDI